jgi:hypothetical protein
LRFFPSLPNVLALPDVFETCGLERIRVESFSHVFLLSDERHDPKRVRAYLEGKLRFTELYQERDLALAVRAGISPEAARKGYELTVAYYRRLLDDPARIGRTHQLEVSTRIVATGRVPAAASG